MTEPGSEHPPTPEDAGYEKRDVNVNKIILAGVISVIIIVVLVIVVFDQFTAVKEELVYEKVLKPESVALRELRTRETEELTTYKVLNEKDSVYRIPIERAMELMAEEAYQRRLEQTQD